MLKIQEYVDIKDYSTLRVGGQFRYFSVINSTEELTLLYSMVQVDEKYENIPFFILGGGSNIVFSDGIIDVIALKIEIKGFDIIPAYAGGNETEKYTDIKIGAGEIWDKIVEKTVDMNLSGLESLSAIPGTVGASPVQNIGAYGSEVKDTILEVEVFEIKTGKIIKLSNDDCHFGYRNSIFKNEAKGKYIITSVTYRLKKNASQEVRSSDEGGQGAGLSQKELLVIHSNALNYPGVLKYFENKGNKNPTLKQIRDAIINIRKEKLPNPKEIPNVGSFFKNPIVLNEIAYKIIEEFPNAKFFPLKDDLTKIPAGWLIENAGLKGMSFGNVSTYDKNALVLINTNNATAKDIISARDEIVKIVFDKFGIVLEQEPEIL
jgi:UDP-N-acetylmuramate dehydrogenase